MSLGRVRVVGVGQPLAGDDAVGLEILRRLRDAGVPPGVELREAVDGAALLTLLETPDPVLVVDAVVGMGPLGAVVELDEAHLGATSDRPVSTHGLDVTAAIALSRILYECHAAPAIRVVGVRIALPSRGACGLSPPVSAAADDAVRAIRARLLGAQVDLGSHEAVVGHLP
jgi:hydrogenase maturation protease